MENWYEESFKSQPMQCEKCGRVQKIWMTKAVAGGIIVSCNYCNNMQILEVEKNESGNT